MPIWGPMKNYNIVKRCYYLRSYVRLWSLIFGQLGKIVKYGKYKIASSFVILIACKYYKSARRSGSPSFLPQNVYSYTVVQHQVITRFYEASKIQLLVISFLGFLQQWIFMRLVYYQLVFLSQNGSCLLAKYRTITNFLFYVI